MTFKESIELRKKDIKLTNWYISPEISIPYCVLSNKGSHTMLGEDNVISNVLAYNEKISDKIAMSLCYDA